jgi:deoxycytidylate deaminase
MDPPEGARLVSQIHHQPLSTLTKLSVNECLCLHAEENALLEAGRERIGEDSVIYCNT